MVTMEFMALPFQQTSELIRDLSFNRGLWISYPASARFTWDGAVAFIP